MMSDDPTVRGPLRARDDASGAVPEQQKADPRQAEREGGIGAMRERSVGGLVGGGGDTGHGSQGAETSGEAISDGASAGPDRSPGAGATAGPDRVLGSSRASPNPDDAPARPRVPTREELGPPPGDKTYHAGPKLADVGRKKEG
jgi:hypothetical protein